MASTITQELENKQKLTLNQQVADQFKEKNELTTKHNIEM